MVAVRNDTESQPPVIRSLRDRVGGLLDKAEGNGIRHLYDVARTQKLPNLSVLFEREDPSTPDELRRGETAFVRAMAYLDLRTQGDPYGSYYASPLADFGRSPRHLALFPEWARRQWVGARYAAQRAISGERAPSVYLSGQYPIGSAARPYDDDPMLNVLNMEPAIPLTEVIGRRVFQSGRDYRGRYLVQPAAGDVRLLAVAEASELPEALIVEGSRTNRLQKFGRKVRGSYEALRDLPLDEFGTYIRELALQTEVDQVGAAIDVMINGDGNSGTSATVYNLTALDSGTTAGNLTLPAWLKFRMKWPNPYLVTAVLGRETEILKLLTLTVGTANVLSAQNEVPAGIRQQFTPINQRLADGVRWGVTTDVPANYLLGFDGRFAIEHRVEQGSDISESERWITSQQEVLTFSVTEGFRVFNTASARILNLNA